MYLRNYWSFYQELRRTRPIMGNYDRKQLAKKLYSEQYAPHLRATMVEHI
jgi:hypothetical protein